jgi:CsoR family transcriptional regulator, copper-sensing transcriptional repressor
MPPYGICDVLWSADDSFVKRTNASQLTEQQEAPYNKTDAPHRHTAVGGRNMPSYVKDKQDILVRLRRMEGQLKGIQRMVESDKYCVDVLNQLSSIIAATQKVAAIIMEDHIRGCVRDALTQDERSDEYVNELVKVVERFTNRK